MGDSTYAVCSELQYSMYVTKRVCVVECADQQDVRQRMNLRWGVMPFRLDFAANPEENIEITFK